MHEAALRRLGRNTMGGPGRRWLAINLLVLARAAEWCQHAERQGRLQACLQAKIPAWTPLSAIQDCFAPCLEAAYRSLGAEPRVPVPVLASLSRYESMLQGLPSWQVSPSHKKGPRLRLGRCERNAVLRCPLDDFNLCLRPENKDAAAVLDQIESNLTSTRVAFWHQHQFKMWPQEGQPRDTSGDPLPSTTLRPVPGATYFSTNPAFTRDDVVPVPLGLRDHLTGAYDANFSPRRVTPKPEQIIRWERELDAAPASSSIDEWLSRSTVLYCDSFRMKWGGGGHSYGRAKMLEAFAENGFECDPTPTNHSAYVKGLRSSLFVAAPRGNGIAAYRIWEALALGAVPVVLKTHTGTHDRLYGALPVVEIGPSTAHPKFDAWTSVTPEFLRGERARIERRARAGGFDVASAYLPYWLGRLFNETLA